MPITYEIDHAARRVEVVVRGEVTPAAYRAHLDDLARQGAMAYGRVVDAREMEMSLRPRDIEDFMRKLAAMRKAHGVARTAVVVAAEATFGMARMYQMRNEAADPGFGVFRSIDEARAWVEEGPAGG
jgi:hypothetical protein